MNKTLGAIFIVAGTAIGGGMIGMPMASIAVGLGVSSILMVIIWALMFFAAMITLEMNLYFKKGVSIAFASEKFLGKYGKILSSFTLGFLFYALLCAYMTGSASILCQIFGLEPGNNFVILILSALFGGIVYGRTKLVDRVSRILVVLMVVCFAVLAGYLLPHLDTKFLSYQPSQVLSSFPLLIPLFFTSFGFHGSIPTIVNYVGTDRKKLRFIFFVGSLIPLIVYLIWETLSLGVLSPQSQIKTVDHFTGELSKIVDGKAFSIFIQGFTLLAILTSFLGVGIGLFDFVEEKIKQPSNLKVALITFTPPLLFALFYPQGFISALCYAAIALSFLAVIIPSLIVLQMKSKVIPKFALILAILAGGIIIVLDLFHMFSPLKAQEKETTKVVEIQTVRKGDIHAATSLVGTIQAKKSVFLTAKNVGILNKTLPSGTSLKKGEVIARLENPEAAKSLDLIAQAEKIAKAQHERMNILAKANAANKQDLERAQNQWILAQKNLLAAKTELEKTQFIAPFDGVVGNYKAREGAQIQNGESVVGFYDPSQMIVEFDIPAHLLEKLKAPGKIILEDKTYTFNTIPKIIDPDTYMAPVYCDVDCTTCFAGKVVDIFLPVESSLSTLLIHTDAVFLKNGKPCVYKIVEGKVELIHIKTGLKEKETVEIKEGLLEGDKIVLYGQNRLYPGLDVEIKAP